MSFFSYEDDRQTFIHNSKHEQILLERYTWLCAMATAVKAGDASTAWESLESALGSIQETDRIYTPEEANPRQSVNRLISCNTLLAYWALERNVYPPSLHVISRRFDKRIEKVTDCSQEIPLLKEMTECYCTLIRSIHADHYGDFSDQIIQKLLANLADPPTLAELAAELYMAPTSVSRRFKAETGQTLPEFVNRSRIRLAKLYLLEDDINFSQVAQMLGFSDASYFSKVFTRYAGMTPTEYIRRWNAHTLEET